MQEPIDLAPTPPAEAPTAPAHPTPGSVLRAAREERGLTVADIAQVTRFSTRQVIALESDDYASLPGATAVRGFVRSYAKFLKIDAAPLLADLEPAVPAPAADIRPPANMGEAEQPSLSERVSPRLIAAGFGLLIVVLAVFWIATRPSAEGESGEASEVSPEAPPAIVAPQSELSPAQPAAPQSVAPAVSAAQSPVAAAAGNTVAPAAPAPAPVPAAASAVVPAAVPAPVAAAPAGLRVEFDGRSWIEVRDATQKVVFVGEYPAGTKQNVDGKAPFQIWIGKASGVRVFMGGRSIDLKPFVREEVARLTVE